MKLNFTLCCIILFNLFHIDIYSQCPEVVDAGTVTVNDDGGTNFPFVVCFGDAVDMTNNGDFILPTTGPNPRLMFALYICPPTNPDDPGADPCYDNSFWTGSDFQTTNNGGIVTFLGQNTFWIVPIAADDGNAPPDGPNYDANGDLCFDINIDQVQMWTFLDDITFDETNVDDCTGVAEITIAGGYDALFPGSYTISNTGSGTLSQSGSSGENITISDLSDGDFYSFNVTDSNGCTASFSGGPINQDVTVVAFDYPDICYDGSAFPNFATPAGGTFSFPNPLGDGADIDPFTGEITNALMDYQVTYSVMGQCAVFEETITVNVFPPIPLPTVDAFYEFCESDNATVTPGEMGDFYTLYENDFTQNALWTGLDFDMSSFVDPGDGPVDFYVSQTVGSCESERTLFTVEILSESPPQTPLFYTVCQGEPVTIIPISVHGNGNPSFNFYGNAALTDFLFNGEEYTFFPTMNTIIYVTEFNSVCETRPASVDIFIELPPTGLAGEPVCDATNAFYSITITTNAANITSNEGLVTNNNDGTFTISDIPSGALVDLTLISSPGNCMTTMSLPEFECSCLPPDPPSDAIDQRICAGDPFPTLSVMVAAGVTVDWYDAAMNGTLLLSNSSTFIPITPGTYYAEARTIADGCSNSLRTPVSFSIDPVPILSMVSSSCSADLLSYDVMIQLIDAASIQSSVGTVSGGAGNYIISGVPIGTDVTYTAFNATMSCSLGPATITSPDCPCPAISPPLPGADQMICEGDPMPELSVAVGAGETADWYDDAIAGNLLSSNSLTYTPATAGTYYAEARNLVNNCVSTRVAISIISNPNPTFLLINTTCSIDLLSYEVNINITDADNLTSNVGTIMNLGGGSYTVTAIASGTDLILTLTNSATNCTAMFTITAPDCSCGIVNAPINTGDVLICTGDAIPALEVTINAGETVDWYDAATAGNLLLANSTTYTPIGAGTYFAETRVIADDCTSTIRTAVTLTIDATPSLVSATTNCAADLLSYEVLLQLNDAFTLQTNEGNITNNGGGSFTISGITTGTDLTYTAFNATGSCSFGPANINTPACPCPAVSPPIVANTMICEGDPIPTLEVSVGMNETADWYDAPNAGNLLLSNSLLFTPAMPGTYYVETRNVINNCIGIRVAVSITSNPIPSFIIDGTTCSEGLLSYDITITVSDTDLISSNVGTIDAGPDTYIISNIPVGVDLSLTLSNTTTGCVLNEIIPAPDCSCSLIPPPVSDGNVSICTGDAIPDLVVSVGNGQIVNWYDAPTAGNLLLANSNSYTPVAPGFYFAETEVLTDGCTSSTRTAVSFEINTTPNLVSVEANCAPNLQSYTADLQIFNTFSIETSAGMVVDNGGGNFTIIDIPVGMNISYTAFNIDSSCVIGPLMIIAPDCSCPALSLPSSSPDQSICEGDPIAEMMVSVGIDQTADWYDAAVAGNLLLAASLNFTPANAGTYYVEARDTINNCISERVAINLAINPIPAFVVDANVCAADLATYSVTITPSDADQVIADQGIVNDNGDGTFTISNIPAADDVQLLLESSTTSCNFSDLVSAPDCSCPVVNAPSGLMDIAICEGETIPTFEAITGADETVDWYDAELGGNLILAGGSLFTPATPGTFYAETRSTIHACTSPRIAITFTINENPSLSVSGFTLPFCNEENGSIDVTTTGGSVPYMYSLNNGAFQPMPSFSGLAADSYDIIIEDANGCRDMITQNLISPDDVSADAGDDMLLTCDVTTVVLDGSNSDAGPNIVYQWFAPDGNPIPDATTTILNVQTAGTYTLMVSNTSSQCSRTDEVNVTADRTPPFIDAGEEQSLSCNTTSVTLVATGNNPMLEFSWTATQGGNIVGNPNAPFITADATGLYQVNVRNPENGCTASDEVVVTEILPEDLDIDVAVTSPACFGDQDGSITVQPANPGATLLYALNDSTFSSNPLFTNLMPGNYQLRVRDENGCQIDTLLFIDQGNDIQLLLNEDRYISLGDSTLLEGINTDDLANIQWSNGGSLRCDTCLATYTYNLQETTLFNLQITDSLGCTTNGDVRVFVDRDRRIFVPNAFSPNNDGNNDFLMVFGGDDVQNINSFIIFDRWGGLVFEAYNFMPNNPLIRWTGQSTQQQELNSNVFVYLLEVTFLDGETEVFSGDVLLIR